MPGLFSGPIEVGLETSDLRGLRTYKNDLVQMTRGLRAADVKTLDDELTSKFGVGIKDMRSAQKLRMAIVVHRGFIETDEEYRMLEERAEEIWDDPSKKDEFDRLNRALSAYSEKADARWRDDGSTEAPAARRGDHDELGREDENKK
jgi:hypothetical protein